MSLTDAGLAMIRDEIGDTPDDATLYGYFDELADASWILTALRVLRRRRAQLAAGGVSSITVPGGLSVSLSSSLSSLDRQISRLERTYADEQAPDCSGGAGSGFVHRQTYRG